MKADRANRILPEPRRRPPPEERTTKTYDMLMRTSFQPQETVTWVDKCWFICWFWRDQITLIGEIILVCVLWHFGILQWGLQWLLQHDRNLARFWAYIGPGFHELTDPLADAFWPAVGWVHYFGGYFAWAVLGVLIIRMMRRKWRELLEAIRSRP